MRLTKDARQQIVKAAIAKAFDKRDAAYQKSRVALADALYAHTYGKVEKLALKLPPNWLTSDDYVRITCDGFTWRNETFACLSTLKLSKPRLFPFRVNEDFRITKAHPFYERCQAVADEFKALEKAKQELRDKLNTLLYSVTTSERLQKEWPEGKKFFPVLPAVSTLPIPHSLTRDINKMLGIGSVA